MKLLILALFPLSAFAQQAVVPVLNPVIPDVATDGAPGSVIIELDLHFQVEEILDEAVRLTATYDVDGSTVSRDFDFLLFANATPVTQANFLGYVDRGDYLGTVIHRRAQNFVVQGGGFKVELDSSASAGVTFPPITVQDPIVNEFAISNTLATISMAKVGGNPDSATSQFFVSLGANSDNLDNQNGGFTVFGRISQGTYPNAVALNNPTLFQNRNLGGAQNSIPVEIDSADTNLNLDDFYRFSSVSRVPLPAGQAGTDRTLSYRIAAQTGFEGITASLSGRQLQVDFAATGTAREKTISVEATDSVGNQVLDTFRVRVPGTFQGYQEEFFESAQLADPSISGPGADANGDGISNLAAFLQGLSPFEVVPRPVDQITYLPGLQTTSGIPVAVFDLIIDRYLVGVTFGLESSETLAAESWQQIDLAPVRAVGGDLERIRFILPETAQDPPRRFYRMSFELIP